ncbi:hypothetical protein F0562_033058 [Nyssa sinensis]|uniref:Uncharacterized protein n=1 Tax=Nyssa sinensis TaxID=561372 RepID=A0A5J5ANX2_9ASTE|nr:hypothetical protein F0562_033058 [Nyssa sinensis]
MATVTAEESIAMGQEMEMEMKMKMKDKWFRSFHSVLVLTIQNSISSVRSLFTKAPPSPSPPPPPPLPISDSTAITSSPNSSTSRYPHLQPPITPPVTSSSYHPFMDTKPPNPTIFPLNERVIDIPTTDSLSDDGREAGNLPPASQSLTTTQSEGLPAQPNQSQMLNPIVQLLRDQELAKTVLTFVIPMMTGVLSLYSKDSSSLRLPLTLLSLSMGLTALWNGILIRNRFPNAANAMEQFGAGSIFFAFFSVVSSLVPQKFVWVPWACFAAILLPSAFSFVPIGNRVESANRASSSTLIYSIPLCVMADETTKTDVLEAPEASKEVPTMTEKETPPPQVAPVPEVDAAVKPSPTLVEVIESEKQKKKLKVPESLVSFKEESNIVAVEEKVEPV